MYTLVNFLPRYTERNSSEENSMAKVSSQPIIVCILSDQTLYVRFENLRWGHFHHALQQFKDIMPHDIAWHQKRNAWALPIDELQRVAIFATSQFGMYSLKLISEPSSTEQLPLF
jgi:hypothetical protein